ncbi:MAG: hypothetical protein BGO78_17985 [Chloroflexi bacterium 44-23]|nr:MAG: hypothetical protein BGO78_17985 [Chloroflexi bacterium 44-23]
MRITIFGGSSPLAGSQEYQFAYQLGALLAEDGHTIITGGYTGIMEAASRGATEASGHVIGITCDEIENWSKRKPNGWVGEEWRLSTLNERLSRLIDSCDAAIALPGGPGTLVEIALMWNRMQINSSPPRPLILVGSGWKNVFETFFSEQSKYIYSDSQQFLSFAETYEEILALLKPPSLKRN